MSSVLDFLRSFGLARLAMIVGVTTGVAIALLLIMVRIGAEPYRVLFADLDYADAQAVIAELDQSGTDFKMREAGTRISILVPRDQASKLRVFLSSRGIVGANSVGYEIFDEQQPLGTTSFQQNLNRMRALEGELARTVSSISGVRSARVHLVLPERTLFSRDQAATTASIMIDAPRTLEPGTIRAITNMVASAVPELIANHITVLDASGNLLAAAQSENTDTMANNLIADRMAAAEARLQRVVSDLVGRIVGPDNVRAEVNADFDFSRFTETAEIVDPDSQVVLSSTLIEESADDARANIGVSVGNTLPGAPATNNTPSSSQTRRTEEITNYEITKTVRSAVRDEGLVLNRLTVAVAINNRNEAGEAIPLAPEAITRIEALVKSAVGFNSARGDQVDIVDLPFTPPIATESLPLQQARTPTLFAGLSTNRIAEITALCLVALALIFFVIRPLISGNRMGHNQTPGLAPVTERRAPPATLNANVSPDQLATNEDDVTEIEHRINIAQIEGQVRASSVKQIQEIVNGHTDESSLILKRWIREAV